MLKFEKFLVFKDRGCTNLNGFFPIYFKIAICCFNSLGGVCSLILIAVISFNYKFNKRVEAVYCSLSIWTLSFFILPVSSISILCTIFVLNFNFGTDGNPIPGTTQLLLVSVATLIVWKRHSCRSQQKVGDSTVEGACWRIPFLIQWHLHRRVEGRED